MSKGVPFSSLRGLASRGDKLLVKLVTVAGGLKSISDTKIGVCGVDCNVKPAEPGIIFHCGGPKRTQHSLPYPSRF